MTHVRVAVDSSTRSAASIDKRPLLPNATGCNGSGVLVRRSGMQLLRPVNIEAAHRDLLDDG
jgi:hypothetical protein